MQPASLSIIRTTKVTTSTRIVAPPKTLQAKRSATVYKDPHDIHFGLGGDHTRPQDFAGCGRGNVIIRARPRVLDAVVLHITYLEPIAIIVANRMKRIENLFDGHVPDGIEDGLRCKRRPCTFINEATGIAIMPPFFGPPHKGRSFAHRLGQLSITITTHDRRV